MPFFVDNDKIEKLRREKEVQKLQKQIEEQNKLIQMMMNELQDMKLATTKLNEDNE